MGNSSQWAHSYQMSELTYGTKKYPVRNKETGLSEWGEEANKLTAPALYTDMDLSLIHI